jgi:hypothetical protein
MFLAHGRDFGHKGVKLSFRKVVKWIYINIEMIK